MYENPDGSIFKRFLGKVVDWFTCAVAIAIVLFLLWLVYGHFSPYKTKPITFGIGFVVGAIWSAFKFIDSSHIQKNKKTKKRSHINRIGMWVIIAVITFVTASLAGALLVGITSGTGGDPDCPPALGRYC